MGTSAIFEAENLTKTYRRHRALDNVSLSLQKGRIYGLVGNNGAGKTTLMRIMMGLSAPTSGRIALFGGNTPKELAAGRKRIGAIIESPILDNNLTGRQNLELLRLLYGIEDRGTVDTELERMGLADRGGEKVRGYSLGMRQRLSIAGALLTGSEFLLLDEPLNGLDPSGIREIRDILLKVNQQRGVTILVSSHYLEQLHLLATDYIILHKGRIVQQFTQEELAERCKGYLLMETSQPEKAAAVLREKYPDAVCEVIDGKTLHLTGCHESFQRLYGIMALEKVEVTRLEDVGITLEDYFQQLIGGMKDA